MKTNDELAGLLAERLYQLMREEANARGVVSIFIPFHPWENTSEVQRAALTNVVARVMREAREQKEEWTRAFIEDELQRMREQVRQPGQPGRFLQVEEVDERARLSR
jgi:UDP-N-acetylglucosamine:LPS N-acetylglucosamine transferase